jgi:Na+/phosphate symporter
MMDDRNDNDSGTLGKVGILLFFVGIYMFLFNLIRAKATSGFTVFFGGLVVFFIELLGAGVIYVACSSTVFRKAPLLYFAFGFVCVLYIVLLIKAHREDARYY